MQLLIRSYLRAKKLTTPMSRQIPTQVRELEKILKVIKQDVEGTNAEQDFSGYVDIPGNQDVQDDETEDNAESRKEPEAMLTRAGARREGIYVEDFPLPCLVGETNRT